MTENGNTTTLDIEGMTCASCVRRVERALSKVEGVETANVNFATETATVTLLDQVGIDRLVAAVEKAGYHAREAAPRDGDAGRSEAARRALVGLAAIVALFAIPAVVLAMMLDVGEIAIADDRRVHGLIVLALATPVQAFLGWRF
jgi:Cu+-exporting ATPase